MILVFSVCLISLSVKPSRSNHVVANGDCSFLIAEWWALVWIYHCCWLILLTHFLFFNMLLFYIIALQSTKTQASQWILTENLLRARHCSRHKQQSSKDNPS